LAPPYYSQRAVFASPPAFSFHIETAKDKQIKTNQFISETADSKIEIQDNDNVQPLTEVQKGC